MLVSFEEDGSFSVTSPERFFNAFGAIMIPMWSVPYYYKIRFSVKNLAASTIAGSSRIKVPKSSGSIGQPGLLFVGDTYVQAMDRDTVGPQLHQFGGMATELPMLGDDRYHSE